MANKGQLHESLSRSEELRHGSDRAFGLVFVVVLAAIGLWPLLDAQGVRAWALAGAGALLTVSLAKPSLLRPLNVLWFRFGLLLSRIMNPVVLAVLYVLTIVPIGLALRASRKDPLRLRLDPSARSYWIVRDPPGPDPRTLDRQF